MAAQVHGSVMGLQGRLRFQDAAGGPLERYSLPVEVEDGTLATAAVLTHPVIMPFLGPPPPPPPQTPSHSRSSVFRAAVWFPAGHIPNVLAAMLPCQHSMPTASATAVSHECQVPGRHRRCLTHAAFPLSLSGSGPRTRPAAGRPGMGPGELQQAIRQKEGQAQVRARIAHQQQFLASYTGVMTVTLPSASEDLMIVHLA